VKTLHPAVHGGILARRNLPAHMEELAKNKIQPIDMVVINLYPFVQTVSKDNVLWTMLWRTSISAAHHDTRCCQKLSSVLVVVDPQDYTQVAEKLRRAA